MRITNMDSGKTSQGSARSLFRTRTVRHRGHLINLVCSGPDLIMAISGSFP